MFETGIMLGGVHIIILATKSANQNAPTIEEEREARRERRNKKK